MAKTFECEIRYEIKNIKSFEKKLKELGARLVYPYEFTDYYYKPVGKKWNPTKKNLRIREWSTPEKPSVIYFVKLEIVSSVGLRFKRALYEDGKVPLFSGKISICRSLLKDLGFELWFVIRKKKAKLWEISKHGFKTAIEYIPGLGWTGELEFEGQDPQKAKSELEKALRILEIPKKLISYKPISAIYLENKRG